MNRENRWKWLIFAAFLGWVVLYSDRSILNPLMGVVSQEYHLSNTELGLLTSVFFLTYTIVQIPSGFLADKIGSKKVIVTSFVAFACISLLTGFVQEFSWFVFCRVVAGFFAGVYYGPQYGLTSRLIPASKRTLVSAIVNSGMAFGVSIGFLLASQMVLVNQMTWNRPYLVLVLPSILVAALFWWSVPDRKEPPVVSLEETARNERSLSKIFKNQRLLAAFILNFVSIYAYFVMVTWLPQFLIAERGVAVSQVGIISSLVPWASLPAMLLIARLSDRYQTTRFYLKYLVPLSASAILFVSLSQSRFWIMFGLICYGFFGKLTVDSLLVAYVGKHAPRHLLSTALSCLNFFGMCASVFAPLVTGVLSDWFGTMKIAFWLSAILLLVGVSIFLVKDKAESLSEVSK